MAIVLCKSHNAAMDVDRSTPMGVAVVSRSCVAALDKDHTIACVLRLAEKHHSNAEHQNNTLKEYYYVI